MCCDVYFGGCFIAGCDGFVLILHTLICVGLVVSAVDYDSGFGLTCLLLGWLVVVVQSLLLVRWVCLGMITWIDDSDWFMVRFTLLRVLFIV